MAKLTLSDLTNLSNPTSVVNTINNNSALTEAALENTLSRDGTAPNQMEADLDMNSNRILNLPAPTSVGEPIRLGDLDEIADIGAILTPESTTPNAIVRWGDSNGLSILNSPVTVADTTGTLVTSGGGDLGSSSARWNTVYGVNENLSGTLTVSGQATFGAGGFSDAVIGTWGGNPNYNALSLNGVLTNTGITGLFSGASGDNSLYFNVPSSMSYLWRVSNTDVAIMTAAGDLKLGGYLRVGGSLVNPANTTAGDLTANRISLGNNSLANIMLRLDSNITGGINSYGSFAGGIIQSDVTSTASIHATNAKTAAASFTLSQLRHYYAGQSTIGSGSAVTNQYGFLADSTLTGATNNYGFYSNIASSTGRWNFYANGTAQNLFNGISTFASATASTSTSTGALIVSAGGLGVAGDGNFGGSLTVGALTSATQIVVSTNDNPLLLTTQSSTANAGAIVMRKARDTTGSPSAVQAGDLLAGFNARGYGATAYSTTGRGVIAIKANENWSDSAQGTYFTVETTNTGSTTRGEVFQADYLGTRVFGYLRVGSLSAPSNTTAGDLTAVRGFFGDTASNGYLRINAGNASVAGWIGWYRPGGTRSGFIGSDATDIPLTLENSAKFIVSGGAASTSISTGALVISGSGGLGVAGSIWSGVGLNIFNATGNGALVINPQTASSQARIDFYQTNTLKWWLGKHTDDTFLLWDNASSRTAWFVNTTGMRAYGYLNVGSTSAPTNTTAGDGTFSRLFVGNVGAAGGVLFQLIGDSNASGVSHGGYLAPNFGSSVTDGRVFASAATIGAGASLSFIRHFLATQGTFTGTATNQSGFHAGATLTGATNNYGFYSDIASGTGRWNFYANGTAANLFNGITTFASATASTSTTTGCATFVGGVGIGGNLYVGGTFNTSALAISGTTDSSSISTGTLVLGGGMGLAKKLYVGDTIFSTPTSATAEVLNVNRTHAYRSLNINTSYTGSLTAPAQNSYAATTTGGGFAFNSFAVTDTGIDSSTYPGGSTEAAALEAVYLAGGGKGSKIAFSASMKATTANSADDPSNGWTGIRSNVLVHNATPFDSMGASVFACGFDVASNATNMSDVCGFEVSSSIMTGGSATNRSVISLVSGRNAAVRASNYDCGLNISAIADSGNGISFTHCILFSDYNGKHPADTNSTLIASKNSTTVKSAIDFSSYTFTDDIFKFANSSTTIFQTKGTGYTGIAGTANTNWPLQVSYNSSNHAGMRVLSTDANNGISPYLNIHRDSASPATSDLLGALTFSGKDSGGNETDYAMITAYINSPTNGTENGALRLNIMKNGTGTNKLDLTEFGLFWKDSSSFYGFRDGTGLFDTNNNESLILRQTASAVNYVEVTNSATGNGPQIKAAGDNTNIDLVLDGKGTGTTKVRTLAITDGVTAPSAVTGQAIIYVDSADGDLKIKFADGTTKTIVVDS